MPKPKGHYNNRCRSFLYSVINLKGSLTFCGVKLVVTALAVLRTEDLMRKNLIKRGNLNDLRVYPTGIIIISLFCILSYANDD